MGDITAARGAPIPLPQRPEKTLDRPLTAAWLLLSKITHQYIE
jgi:hypothetical protein